MTRHALPGRGAHGGMRQVARSGAVRRRVQAAVLTVTTLVSVAASVLGVGLLAAANAPFDRAFTAQRGAHLRVDFDAAAVSASELASSATASGVTAAAGPFPTALVRITIKGDSGNVAADGGTGAGRGLGLLTVAGRSSPRAAVDSLALTAGRWAASTTGLDHLAFESDSDVAFPRVSLVVSSPERPLQCRFQRRSGRVHY